MVLSELIKGARLRPVHQHLLPQSVAGYQRVHHTCPVRAHRVTPAIAKIADLLVCNRQSRHVVTLLLLDCPRMLQACNSCASNRDSHAILTIEVSNILLALRHG